MKKTKFSDEAINIADKMVTDYANLERNLRELRTILAVICAQQDDKCLTVPFRALKELPAGVELEVSAMCDHYQFSLVGADGIPLANQVSEREPLVSLPPVRRDEPCEDCPAPQECWNYCKEPDPANPGGPFRIKSWFECSNPASSEDVIDNSALAESAGLPANDHVPGGLR